MDEPKKMAKSDAWEDIKLCHLVNITWKDSNKLDWIKKGKVCYWESKLCLMVIFPTPKNNTNKKGTSPKGRGTTPPRTKQKRQSLLSEREQTLPFQQASPQHPSGITCRGISMLDSVKSPSEKFSCLRIGMPHGQSHEAQGIPFWNVSSKTRSYSRDTEQSHRTYLKTISPPGNCATHWIQSTRW